MTDEYLLSPESGENELSLEKSLRPQLLSQYIGQRKSQTRTSDLHRSCQKSGRTFRSCSVVRASWIRKNDDGHGHC